MLDVRLEAVLSPRCVLSPCFSGINVSARVVNTGGREERSPPSQWRFSAVFLAIASCTAISLASGYAFLKSPMFSIRGGKGVGRGNSPINR